LSEEAIVSTGLTSSGASMREKMSEIHPKISPSKENAANMPISCAFLVGSGLAHSTKV
jgi:hypothetical protein